MHVELLKHWRGYRPGTLFTEMPPGPAAVLIKRGFAKEVSDTPAKPATKPKRKPCDEPK